MMSVFDERIDDASTTLGEAVAAQPEVAIQFSEISKIFPARGQADAVTALAKIDFSVRRGCITGVIGPSGAGKSTLIRLVNGLERPSSGIVKLFGRDVTDLTEPQWRRERAGIGMIFQHFNLLSSRTAAGNIALPLEIAGHRSGEIHARVARLLALVGLSDKSDRYPSELSGGQKQRVGIARALATNPKILLCDEATSALDPETTRSILALLKRVNRELGVTILLITHEIPVIKEICDDVAVIEHGSIIEAGPVFTIFTSPKHPLTRRFVSGVTNVDVPERLAGQLLEEPIHGAQAVLRIGFVGKHATAPIISRLTSMVNADINIIAGRIDAIGDRSFGSLIVTLPIRDSADDAAVAALSRLNLTVERLGFLPTSNAA